MKRLKLWFRSRRFPVPQRANFSQLWAFWLVLSAGRRSESWAPTNTKIMCVNCPWWPALFLSERRVLWSHDLVTATKHILSSPAQSFRLAVEQATFFWPRYRPGNILDLICTLGIQCDACWCLFPLTNELRLRRKAKQTKMTSNLALSCLLRLCQVLDLSKGFFF